MAWAYAHPVRAQALMILSARVSSPRQMAEEMEEPIGKVSYHVRQLRDAKLIELVDTDHSRGGVQHFYRATHLPILKTDEMIGLTREDRQVGSVVVLNLMVSDVAASVEAGVFDNRPERVLVRYHASVDQRGLRELADLYTDAIYHSIMIHGEAQERMEKTGEEGIPVAMHALVFEMPESSREVTDPVVLKTTLEWAHGSSPLSDRGGSKGRRSDEGDPEG